MKHTITNAAEITILEPIDNNYKTGGGDINVGGCLVIASKGKPFTPMAVYGSTTNLEDYFGTPLPKKSEGMEGLRHVNDAIQDCSYVNTVRVVNATKYRYPALSFLIADDAGDTWAENITYNAGIVVTHKGKKYLCLDTHTSTAATAPDSVGTTDWSEYTSPVSPSQHRWDETITVGDGSFMAIYPVDGATSATRSVRITSVDSTAKRFTLGIYDVDSEGEEYLLEEHTAGIDVDDKDDMGLSAYIKTVFERDSDCFNVDFMDGLEWADVEPLLKAIETTKGTKKSFYFQGGNTGGSPEITDWQRGVDVFRNERVSCDLLFAAGIYEPDVLMQMAQVADDRHIAFFYDIPPSLKSEEAIKWNADIGLKSRHSRSYYSPYSANDQWRGGTCVWGVSGAMAGAKARCNKIISTGSTPGVHYAPAGEKRGYLTRTGLKQLFPEDRINRDDFYDARINPIVPISTGGCCADDDLVQHFQSNYLRFGWINDVLDYIDHRFYEGAAQVKFDPDGLTKNSLQTMTEDILKELVNSEALVKPRDATRDGTSEYTIKIEQVEIDLWKVTWDVCITGAARRIVGQPRLIK